MYISITKTTHPGTLLPSDQLGFGIHYTDHMFIMDYSDEKGWYDPRIVPFQNISLSPAACVFHYGAEVFEGLKAYRRPDGEVQLFRPWDNMERMKNSAIRLGLPVVPPEDALEAVKALVKVDERWVPSDPGTSLYIRPFLYGTDAKLGLHGVHTAQFIIILSPVGSYFDNGMEPVKIIVETEDVRAVRGGTGEAKCGGNYGASNRAGERAFANGYSQVLWLDGVEHKYVEEGGGMNVVFKINGRIITPMLTGSILPGVTRRSCLQLFEDWGMPVEERLISVDELFEAAANGTLEEAMCVGTAAVICPIGELTYEGKAYTINTALHEGGSNLSGGQRQRLAMARALLHDTPIYLFDEATSNVDAESENDIMQAIHSLAGKKTIILISHRLANVVHSDCIYAMSNGRVIEQGTHAELLARQGAYSRLFTAQKQLEMLGKEDA